MNRRKHALKTLFIATATSLTLPLDFLHADKPDDEVVHMEGTTVSDVPYSDQILPTVRPISSVMGDDRSVLDTPRSVTSVNQAWMEERHVHDAMDFGQFSPGVYSAAQYGIPATPQIRGDLGELYVNGQRTNFSRNSVFPSFNGIEAMDIVKGPGSAIYGPQGEGPGGYVNFVTKEPFFDATHVDVSTTLGYWSSGHSYFNPEAQIDIGGPINSDLAYRVSLLSRTGDGYYLNQKNETADAFVALTWRATPKLVFAWWGQIYNSRFNEVTGVNRVTQDFIDHGTYIGGVADAGPDDFGGGAVDGTFAVLDPATAYRVKLAPDRALLGPTDSAQARHIQTQLVTTYTGSENFKIINRTYLEDRNSRKLEYYGYDEYVPKDQSFQDRLEFHVTAGNDKIINNIIAGADFRYSRLISYQDFTNEPFFYYDLAKDLSGIYYPGYVAQHDTFGSGLQVPGQPGYSGQIFFNTGGNQDTHIYDSAIFAQDSIGLGSQWSTILGFRIDHIDANTMNPSVLEVFDTGTGATFNPGIFLPKGYFFKANDSVNDPSFFGSVIFKPTENRTFYFTYDRTEAITGSANFGGVDVGADFSGTPEEYRSELHTSLTARSTLYEVGYKESFLNNTLFFGSALFQQTRMRPNLVGPANEVKTRGLELETVYQPSKKVSFNANLTWQDAVEYGTFFFEQTGNYLDGYPVGFVVDGTSGTGVGSPNFIGYVSPVGRVKAAGVPRFMANAFVTYEIWRGLGIGVGPQFQGRQNANQEATLHIPNQIEWDGFIYYRVKTWDVQLSVKNILNSRLLDPIDVGFAGNDTVFVRPGITASVTVRYHF